MPMGLTETERARCPRDLGELLQSISAGDRFDVYHTDTGRLYTTDARLISFNYSSRKRRIPALGILDGWELIAHFEAPGGQHFPWKFSAEELPYGPIRKRGV